MPKLPNIAEIGKQLLPQRSQRNAEEKRKNKAYRGFTRMNADQEIGKTFNHKGHEGTQRKIG
jgi:hypothetical protein